MKAHCLEAEFSNHPWTVSPISVASGKTAIVSGPALMMLLPHGDFSTETLSGSGAS